MQAQETQNLVKLAINGDAQAFSALMEAHYDMVYATAYKWCGHAQDAEDVAQEVCIKVGRNISRFRMDSAFTSWLYRITLNTVRDMQRKKKPDTALDAVTELTDEREKTEKTLEQQQLWLQVRQLPEKQCDAVMLVYAQELSHAETADVMGCKESTVSWYIHEAKKQLKEWMGPDGR